MACLVEIGSGQCAIGFGDGKRVFIRLGVEFGDHLSLLDCGTFVDGKLDDASRLAEGQVDFADVDVAVQRNDAGGIAIVVAQVVGRAAGGDQCDDDGGEQFAVHGSVLGVEHGDDVGADLAKDQVDFGGADVFPGHVP